MSRHKWRIDSSKATKVELGVHCGVASFSNRARWAAIGLLLLATGLFLVVGLTAHTGSFALPEESDFGGVLLLLSEQTGIVCGILLLSMLCCGEGPTASVPGTATAPRQCGRGCDFDPRVPSNAARYATAAALVALGIVAFILSSVTDVCRNDCDDCASQCSVLLVLSSMPITTAAALLVTMACCIAKPRTASQVRLHSTAQQLSALECASRGHMRICMAARWSAAVEGCAAVQEAPAELPLQAESVHVAMVETPPADAQSQ